MKKARAKASAACADLSREAALTGEHGSLVLRHGRVVNVLSGEVYEADVLVVGDRIVSVGEVYHDAREVLDCSGRVIVPGFIEGHIHIESSLLHPAEFARLLVRHGTTAVIADPHEIANVLGAKGFEYMLEATEDLPLDVFLMVPSCVPATKMETSGAELGPKDIARLLKLPRVLGLAEFMNFPGVICGDADAAAKLKAARDAGKVIDGHAPGLRGSALQAYALAGIGSDHECLIREEARDKLRAGLRLMIREGSAARNLTALAAAVNMSNSRRCMLVTDDKLPGELLSEGHLDANLRKAIALGLDAVTAIQMVTLNPAEYFGLSHRGAIAPGYLADMVVVDNLERLDVLHVVKSGRIVLEQRQPRFALKPNRDAAVLKTMKVRKFGAADFRIPKAGTSARVIHLVADQILTRTWHTEPKVEKGLVVADLERDILKLAVIERHCRTGNIGLGLVAGFGLKQGALASSVAHDSHNIIVVGTNDRDMAVAAQRVVQLGGGYVAASRGRARAELALPIAGLMSTEPAEKVVEGLNRLLKTAQAWGSRVHNPFATLSFLALPVIPELKLTDKGLFDVGRFCAVSLWGED